MAGKRQSKSIDEIIRHYLNTGDDTSRAELAYKPPFPRPTKEELQIALSEEVRRRERDRPRAMLPAGIETLSLARAKAAPMVRGLFPPAEREPVQGVLEKSVIFLTADNIHEVLTSARWLHTAWSVANIYLDSIGANTLGNGDFRALGLGEETTSYISLKYFSDDDPCADYVVHEMAHVFHNWKRAWTGLRETRHREFLLNIDFRKRETFAFACEVYSRILELGRNPRERQPAARYICPGVGHCGRRGGKGGTPSDSVRRFRGAEWVEAYPGDVFGGENETPRRHYSAGYGR